MEIARAWSNLRGQTWDRKFRVRNNHVLTDAQLMNKYFQAILCARHSQTGGETVLNRGDKLFVPLELNLEETGKVRRVSNLPLGKHISALKRKSPVLQ